MDPSKNLIAAKCLDPQITNVFATAQPVAIYQFKESQWKKSGHEGVLLVCERAGLGSKICLVVLSQVTPANYVEYIRNGSAVQRKGEYLLYKIIDSEEVRAMWFYAQKDCDSIYIKLKEVMEQHQERTKNQQNVDVNPQAAKASRAQANQLLSGVPARDRNKSGKKEILNLLSNAKKDKQASAENAQGSGSHAFAAVVPSNRAGGDDTETRSVHHSSTSGPVENFLKSFTSSRNAGSGDTNISTTNTGTVFAGAGTGGILGAPSSGANNAQFIPISKGRGRTIAEDVFAPGVQKLLNPPIGGSNNQHVSSAFTSVSAQPSIGVTGPKLRLDSMITTCSSSVAGEASQILPRPPKSPPMLLPVSPRQENLNLLTPNEIDPGIDSGAALVQPMALSDSSTIVSFDQGIARGLPMDSNFTNEQAMMNDDQLMSAFMRLMRSRPDFVDFVDQELSRRRYEREFGGSSRRNNVN